MLNGSSLMNGSDLFVYDLVEVVRQVLANLHLQAYTDMIVRSVGVVSYITQLL